ncbi:MAG: hypothetical protein AB4060_06565 [Crocosphaera sp.]
MLQLPLAIHYLVDTFARQENLSQDINNIMVQIGKPRLEIPYVNRSNDVEFPLSKKSEETLLDFYYDDYILWKSYSIM